jgi:hypothetical protein
MRKTYNLWLCNLTIIIFVQKPLFLIYRISFFFSKLKGPGYVTSGLKWAWLWNLVLRFFCAKLKKAVYVQII